MNKYQRRFEPNRSVLCRSSFVEKIKGRTARIAVIGLGYVGLPLILGFAARGLPTIGVDIDQAKVDTLAAGRSYIQHITDKRIVDLIEGGKFSATTDFSRLSDADAIILCVPTPLTKHLEPDLSYIASTARAVAQHLEVGQLVVLESTTYPGTTRDVMLPILEHGSKLKAGRDFFVAYSPEREDPGNPKFETTSIPKIVGAMDAEALERASAL